MEKPEHPYIPEDLEEVPMNETTSNFMKNWNAQKLRAKKAAELRAQRRRDWANTRLYFNLKRDRTLSQEE